MSSLLALENTVTTTPRHASNVQQLRSVDHVVVFSPCNANTLGLDLEAQAALVFPEGRSHPWLHTWWSNLTRSVRYVLCLEMLLSSDGTRWPGRSHGRQRNGLLDHCRAHGRRDWVRRSHRSHRTRILISTITVRWVRLRGRLESLRLAIRILANGRTGRRRRSVLHVSLRLVHAGVTLSVLVPCWHVLRRVGGLLGRRSLQTSRVLTSVDRRRIGGVGVVRLSGDGTSAERISPGRRTDRGMRLVSPSCRCRVLSWVPVAVVVGSPGLYLGDRWQRQLRGSSQRSYLERERSSVLLGNTRLSNG